MSESATEWEIERLAPKCQQSQLLNNVRDAAPPSAREKKKKRLHFVPGGPQMSRWIMFDVKQYLISLRGNIQCLFVYCVKAEGQRATCFTFKNRNRKTCPR